MGKFSDFADDVAELRRDLDNAYEDATEDAMESMEREISQELRQNDSIAREVLYRAIQTGDPAREIDGRHVHSTAVKMPDWARYLEHGTGQRAVGDTLPDHNDYEAPDPGPPYEKILRWIVAKNLQPREYDTQYGLAEAIQDTIAQLGTFPHPFYRPVWYSRRRGYESVVDENHRALKRELRRL